MVLPQVDVLIANEEDCGDVLDIRAGGTDVHAGRLDVDRYPEVARQVVEQFPNLRFVATTLRQSVSASHNNWGAMLYEASKDEALFAPRRDGRYQPYEIRNIGDRVGGGDAFAHRVALAQNFFEVATFAKLDAEGHVARLRRRSREDEIAEAGKSRHGLASGAEGDTQSLKLCKPARDQRRPRALAEAAPFDDAGGDGEDVFDRAAEFRAGKIAGKIRPEMRRADGRHPARAKRIVGAGERHRCRLAHSDVARKARTGQDRGARLRPYRRNDLGHHEA